LVFGKIIATLHRPLGIPNGGVWAKLPSIQVLKLGFTKLQKKINTKTAGSHKDSRFER